MKVDEQLLRECFPFAKARPSQMEAIEEIIQAKLDGYEHVVLDGPTGSGKSGVAYTVAKYITAVGVEDDKKACITTTSKFLQNQYRRDFRDLKNIMSSSDPIYTCDDSHNRNTEGCITHARACKNSCFADCPYKIASKNFIRGPISLTNTHFIANLRRSFELLVFDECHEIGNVVTGMAEFEVYDPDPVMLTLALEPAEYDMFTEVWEGMKQILEKIPHGEVIQTPFLKELEDIDFTSALKRVEGMAGTPSFRSVRAHVNRFKKAVDSCLLTAGKEIIKIRHKPEDPHIIKPVYASDFSDELLFSKGNFLLHMSATVCGERAYSRELGFEDHKWKSVHIEHPIDVKRRSFYFTPVAWMSAKTEERDTRLTAEAIDKLIEKHNANTIIHSASYKRAEKIKELSKHNIEVPRSANDAVKYLEDNIGKAFIASPSVVAGVDGKDDICRLNILCKVPFPSFGDPRIKFISKHRPELISLQVVRNMVQAAGRGTRHEEDYSHTYMLDGIFEKIFAQNPAMFPDWFQDSIVWNPK